VSSLGTFVWSIADQLRGVYKPHQYGNVVLPMTILRRLDSDLRWSVSSRVCDLGFLVDHRSAKVVDIR